MLDPSPTRLTAFDAAGLIVGHADQDFGGWWVYVDRRAIWVDGQEAAEAVLLANGGTRVEAGDGRKG